MNVYKLYWDGELQWAIPFESDEEAKAYALKEMGAAIGWCLVKEISIISR